MYLISSLHAWQFHRTLKIHYPEKMIGQGVWDADKR